MTGEHPTLEDGTIRLRPWRADDATWLREAWADGTVAAGLGAPDLLDAESARQRVTVWQQQVDQETAVRLAIEDAVTSDPLGGVALPELRYHEGTTEAAYWLAAPARGRGVATRALTLVTRYAFDELGLFRVELLMATSNAASQAVARRAGFVFEGVLRSVVELRGERVDMAMWSRLPSDPEPGSPPASPPPVDPAD